MLDANLIDMTDLDGTLVFRSNSRHSLTRIMCGQVNYEIVYQRLFMTSPFIKRFVKGSRTKCFVKQSNKDLPFLVLRVRLTRIRLILISWNRVTGFRLILISWHRVTEFRLTLISWNRVTEFRLTLISWNRVTEFRLTLIPRVRLSELHFVISEVNDLSDAAWNTRQGIKPGNKLPRDPETFRGVLQGLNKASAF